MNRIAFVLCAAMAASLAQAQQQGIINNSDSPHVKLKSINIGDCQWTEGFWADKFKLCEEVMVPHMGTILEGDVGHAYNNFKIAAGLKKGEHQGFPWHDGDFYKWMESALYVYGVNKDERIVKDTRTATIHFHTVKPVKMVDLLSGDEFGISNPSTVELEVPCGLFRFVDIELSETF